MKLIQQQHFDLQYFDFNLRWAPTVSQVLLVGHEVMTLLRLSALFHVTSCVNSNIDW